MMVSFVVALNLLALLRFYGLEEMGRVDTVLISFKRIIFGAVFGGLVVGFIIGVLDNMLNSSTIGRKSFGVVVLVKTVVFSMAFTISFVIVFMAREIFFTHDTIAKGIENLGNALHIQVVVLYLIYGFLVLFIINFIREANKKVGPGILFKFFMGKYHKPIEEDRVFMFLDLKSSTTIAEKLGHIRYSSFIQDCFKDLTSVVKHHSAEIYQYVGDEAVLTWEIKEGIDKANCLNLYFDYDKALNGRKSYYLENYDTVPVFKAGINCGMVTTAEVGEIKSEIAYHGDVLNTAARIQAECNTHKKNLLISADLKNLLDKSSSFKIENIGEIILRGKENPIGIYSIEIENGEEAM